MAGTIADLAQGRGGISKISRGNLCCRTSRVLEPNRDGIPCCPVAGRPEGQPASCGLSSPRADPRGAVVGRPRSAAPGEGATVDAETPGPAHARWPRRAAAAGLGRCCTG